jgi:Capsule assembly protein Wzi
MRVSRRASAAIAAAHAIAFAGFLLAGTAFLRAQQPAAKDSSTQTGSASPPPASPCEPASLGSPYIPVDSWVYPAMLRLYSLGYVDTPFLGLRPWTRTSIMHMLEEAGDLIDDGESAGDPGAAEARQIYDALNRELQDDMEGPCGPHKGGVRVESTYTLMRGISGTPLRDSYHLGSTVINDYGRPYENGFNNYTGASGYATAGRFALYVRGEFQGAPSAAGYSAAMAAVLSCGTCTGVLQGDEIPFLSATTGAPYPQDTIPFGPIATITRGSLLEAYVSYQIFQHVVSFGKQDEWLGPGLGGSMAYSNNAENIYAFHIDRVEPLHVPGLSVITGPFRYEFLVGELRGHTLVPNPSYTPNSGTQPNVFDPGNPWVHVEKVSLKPLKDFEIGFERTAMFGGEGHEGVSLHSFLRSFFSTSAGAGAQKNGNTDPGARFASFDLSYRLPFVRKWLTLYADGEVHDDVSPIDAPRRASWRPGTYLSHVPAIPKLDLRVEAASTEPVSTNGQPGRFMYWEYIEREGYTNQGQLFGDWIGRADKGGQAWITYHLSGNEWIQVSARNQKADSAFIPGSTTQMTAPNSNQLIPGGTTLNDISFQAVKRIGRDFEVNGNFALEHWKVPLYLTGEQTVTTTNIQLTWYPERKVSF